MARRVQRDTLTVTRERVATQTPRPFRVLLHNDDFTTMEFVVAILIDFFQKPAPEAIRLMLEVHHRGSCVAGVFPREIAETKVAEVSAEAKRQGMPLLATAEPDAPDAS